jgi:membrane dipeptidase
MLIVDAHEDIAWNIMTFGRDYSVSVLETREREENLTTPDINGHTMLGWPEYQLGNIALIFSTLFAAPRRTKMGEWDTQCYASTKEAMEIYSRQLDEYYRLCDRHPEKFFLLSTKNDLQSVLDDWQDDEKESRRVGLIILMEGAEAIAKMGELDVWWQRGVRIIGPAWTGTRFCGGTHEPGPLTSEGYDLLGGMAKYPFCLDISHMDEKAVLQTFDYYSGPIIASHSNALALLKGIDSNRFLSDRVITGLLERNGVIGVIPFNTFLKVGWKNENSRDEVGLEHLVAHIDYICQLAGNADHVGLGTDFDGGFGLQSIPKEIGSIADMKKIKPFLLEKGYSEEDVVKIMGRNWINVAQNIMPENI